MKFKVGDWVMDKLDRSDHQYRIYACVYREEKGANLKIYHCRLQYPADDPLWPSIRPGMFDRDFHEDQLKAKK